MDANLEDFEGHLLETATRIGQLLMEIDEKRKERLQLRNDIEMLSKALDSERLFIVHTFEKLREKIDNSLFVSVDDMPNGDLTTSEWKVLRLLVYTNLTIMEIGRELYVSPNTVKTHTGNIYRKLQVSKRHELKTRVDDLGLTLARTTLKNNQSDDIKRLDEIRLDA